MKKICCICNKEKDISCFYKIIECNNKIFPYCIQCSNEKSKEWYQKNKKKHKKRTKIRYDRIRDNCIILLGSKCKKCGIKDKRVLCIDHIDNNGYEERMHTGMSSYYSEILKKIKNGSDDYQLLCWNCNHLKRIYKNEN